MKRIKKYVVGHNRHLHCFQKLPPPPDRSVVSPFSTGTLP